MMMFFSSLKLACAGSFFLDRTVDSVHLGPYADVYEDKTGNLSLTDILSQPNSGNWTRTKDKTLNFGFTSSVYFIKVTLVNKDNEKLENLLEIAYPLLDHIKVDFIRNGVLAEGYLLGDSYPFSARIIEHRNFIIPVHMNPSETVDVFFRIKTKSSMQIPLNLTSVKTFIRQNQIKDLCYGMYYGIMIAMILYNLFVFISVREASYLYYVFYVISMASFLFSINGFSYQYLWPDSIWWNEQFLAASIGSVVLFAHLFTRIFLDLPGYKPGMNTLSIYLAIFLFLNLMACFIIPYGTVIFSTIGIAVFMILVSLLLGVILWISGYTAARFYTLSWLAMLLGGAALALNKIGVLPRNPLTENALQIGSVVEMLFLSFALADRLSTEKSVRFDAQLKALKHEKLARVAQVKALDLEKEARQAQEEALLMQKKANENLENNVRMRTRELEIVNARLRELSTTDSLTGLKNRRYFNEVFYREYNRAIRDKTPLSCLIMDIDHFKKINDSYGHLLGDECLKEVAQIIQDQLLRENDFLSRYGGEEFCVLLTNTPADGAFQVAENIRLCVEKLQVVKGGMIIPITISIGVATEIPVHKKYAETLLNRADEALYQSKSLGRNRVTLFEDEMKERTDSVVVAG